MTTEKCIEVLEDFRCYVNENWDEEYRKSINEVNEAVPMAIRLIKERQVCGTVQMNGETYLISK